MPAIGLGIGIALGGTSSGGGGPPVYPPVADFTADVTSGGYPLTVQFTDTSTNTPTSWLWDFGDGSTDTAQNPSHTYTSIGVYTVELTATNDDGSDTVTKTDYISVQEVYCSIETHPDWDLDPVYSTISPSEWCYAKHSDGTEEYYPNSSIDPETTLTTYTAQGLIPNPKVSGTIKLVDSGTITWSGVMMRLDSALAEEYVIFRSNDGNIEVLERYGGSWPVTLTVPNPPGTTATFSVALDGANGTLILNGVTHTFTVNNTHAGYVGFYHRRADVLQTLFYDLKVEFIPVASFTFDDTYQLAVKFTDTSLGNPTSWFWDFGDGTTSALQHPTHAFADGAYTVSLTATNSVGSNTTTQTVAFNFQPQLVLPQADPVTGLYDMDQWTDGNTTPINIPDHEGIIREIPAGVVPIEGARDVHNQFTGISDTPSSQSNIPVIAGNKYHITIGAGSDDGATVSLAGAIVATLTADGSNRIGFASGTPKTANTELLNITVSGNVTELMLEDVTGQSVMTPSEYVNTGDAFGDDLATGGEVAADWSKYGNNTITDDNGVRIDYVDNASGGVTFLTESWILSQDLVEGNKYTVAFDVKVNTGLTSWRLHRVNGSTTIAGDITSTTYTTVETAFIAGVDPYIDFANMGTGESVWIKNIVVKNATDGRAYYNRLNGNTVDANGVVTEAPGALITPEPFVRHAPEATNLIRYSSTTNGWTINSDGQLTVNRIGQWTEIRGLGLYNTNDYGYAESSVVSDSARIEPSFILNPVSTTGIVFFRSYYGSTYGSWDIDLSLLDTNTPNRITRDHPAVTVNSEFTATSAGSIGVRLFTEDGPLDLDTDLYQLEEREFSTPPIETSGAAAIRYITQVRYPYSEQVFNQEEGMLILEHAPEDAWNSGIGGSITSVNLDSRNSMLRAWTNGSTASRIYSTNQTSQTGQPEVINPHWTGDDFYLLLRWNKGLGVYQAGFSQGGVSKWGFEVPYSADFIHNLDKVVLNYGLNRNISTLAINFYNKDLGRQWIEENYPGPLCAYEAVDLNGSQGDRVSEWVATRSGVSSLVQNDPAYQPVIGPNGGVSPADINDQAHMVGGEVPSGDITVLIYFVQHGSTNGALVGSDPSSGDDRFSMSHWGDDQSYWDYGDIGGGASGRLTFTYEPPNGERTFSVLRQDGNTLSAIIDGGVVASKSNTTRYSGGKLVTHITALSAPENTWYGEILAIAVYDKALTDEQIQRIRGRWQARYGE